MKIAIIAEGHSEAILIRQLLLLLFDNFVEMEFVEINRKENYSKPSVHLDIDLGGQTNNFFFIVIAGNDEKVMSYMKEQSKSFIEREFDQIIGIRDVFSERYKKYSKTICEKVIAKFVDAHQETINSLEDNEKIFLFWEQMENEAWILSMPRLLQRIDERLTVDFINRSLNLELNTIVPEKDIFHPANIVERIFNLIDKKYDKSQELAISIYSHIDEEVLRDALLPEKCLTFERFYSHLQNLSSCSQSPALIH